MGTYLLDEKSEDLILAVIKNDCPTCQLLIPTLDDLGKTGKLTVVLQDEMDFPFKNGKEVARTVGWSREEWRKITGDPTLGDNLPEFKPG